MRMRLKTLYFAANRPTIGALIALGGDVGAAFSTGKPEVSEPHWAVLIPLRSTSVASLV